MVALFVAVAGAAAVQGTAASKEQAEDAASFKEFTARVNEYLKLHKAVEKQLPAMKDKEALPEMITAHQQALARKLAEKRPNAKPGDIFTHRSREAFRHVIRGVFRNPKTGTVTTTVSSINRQRRTAKAVPLKVNGNYPDAEAETTFPPALLQKLPLLPEELAYRIVGRDLVLVDLKANMVVDLLHEVIP
ncbi:MAG: hypothetical protein M3P27_07680 [Acidobacteriota bacterium]|nr:hypothetical protein [Acidobacteriota bacterium]